jgi:hypothetical protein
MTHTHTGPALVAPTPEPPTATPATPGRMWRIAKLAAEHGWDVKIVSDELPDEVFRLQLRDGAHTISLRWRLREYQGEQRWSPFSSSGRAGCDGGCRWKLNDLDQFLADPPTTCTPYELDQTEHENNRLRQAVDAVLDIANDIASGQDHTSLIADRLRKAVRPVSGRAMSILDRLAQGEPS